MSALSQISFRSDLAGYLGLEQEFFLFSSQQIWSPDVLSWGQSAVDHVTLPTPRSPEFLDLIGDERWTYELSACQVEFRTRPHDSCNALIGELTEATAHGRMIAVQLGCQLEALGYVPDSIPLDVYPSGRYREIAAKLPTRVLRAACQVAGIHVHYGCRDIEHALAVYHALRKYTHVFVHLGDLSGGRRMEAYRLVKPNPLPPKYDSVAAFDSAHSGNLRDCYHLIRITPYGTVEVRCFGSTSDMAYISSFVRMVQSIADSVG